MLGLIGGGAPSPTSGTGAWLRATAPTIATPTFTGQAKFDTGSAAQPSLANAAGTTGLFFGASPAISVTVGGVEQSFISGTSFQFLNKIHPFTNGVGDLGASTNRWLNIYTKFVRATAAGVRIGADVTADASDHFHVDTSGSANAVRTNYATGNSGFGSAADGNSRVKIVSDTQPAPLLLNSTHATTPGLLDMHAANITDGGLTYFSFGKAPSANNRAAWSFNYVSAASATNYAALAFYGGSDVLRCVANGNVIAPVAMAIGSTAAPHASCLLDLVSTTKALGVMAMTTTQKNAVATPRAGDVVYDATLGKLCIYTTAWEAVTSA